MHGVKLLASAAMGLALGACGEGEFAPASPDSAPLFAAVPHIGEWGPAVSLDPGGSGKLNTAALEGCPSESTDGRRLFYASNRAGGVGGIDLWVAHRAPGHAGWSEPDNLPAPVNSAYNDFCPTPLPGGDLLFVSTRPGGCGDGTADIYQTRLHPVRGWLEPEHLGCELNSVGNEFSPSYVAAGGGMLFFSSDRNGGPGQDRIHVSVRRADGSWGPAVEVAALNAPGFSTARPNLSRDGRLIVFDSDRPGGAGGPDIWAATRASVAAPWSAPVNLGPHVNSPSAETRPFLSADGRRLYFGSARAGGMGSLDIYVATRQ